MASEYRISETSAPEDWQEWVAWLKPALHSRTQWRLPLVLLGLLFARGRRRQGGLPDMSAGVVPDEVPIITLRPTFVCACPRAEQETDLSRAASRG